MVCMKLGSKPDVFHLDGNSWFCTTGLPSDVVVEVGETLFHLHKFPLLSRSGLLERLISEGKCELSLDDIPGGAAAFSLAAKFCYGVRIDLSASNVASLRCAAEYLQMTEDFGESNLAAQCERFLDQALATWTDSLEVLVSCQSVMPFAEDLHVVPRCLTSLSGKACSPGDSDELWNGISGEKDWWFEDVSSSLPLPLYKRLILAVESRGMKPERISASLMHYANKNLAFSASSAASEPSSSIFGSPRDSDQRSLVEEISGLLPIQKGSTPTDFLLHLLRTSMGLQCSRECRDELERRVGAELDGAALEDLLIPSLEYTTDTLYDVDCVQRILDHFVAAEQERQIIGGGGGGGAAVLTPVTAVASLVDGFLAEVAPDPNLKMHKFLSLARVIPDYARPLDDGIYRAIDMYLKAHEWVTESEREQICRLMNCQKLSLEASTHAAQNERLPLRVIVQVLFFEQLRLRTSVAGWFFVSDSLEGPPPAQHQQLGNQIVAVDTMRDRVSVLEKECLGMKDELEKMVKTRGSWNMLLRRIGLRFKSKTCELNPLVKNVKPVKAVKQQPHIAAEI